MRKLPRPGENESEPDRQPYAVALGEAYLRDFPVEKRLALARRSGFF